MSAGLNLDALNSIRGNPTEDVKHLRRLQPQNINATDGVQAVKNEIIQGILSGGEPYPLLLKAIEVISSVTDNNEFLTICKDVMQGAGMLSGLPPEWEQEGVEKDLQRLETAQRNISIAIKAHRQRLEKYPVIQGEQGDSLRNGKYSTLRNLQDQRESEYKKRIRRCFLGAYKFLINNIYPCGKKDWERIAGSLSPYTDPLTVGLVGECIMELEREYKENGT